MPTIKAASLFGNGSVKYIPQIDPRPETRETARHGNVTTNIINSGQPGFPAHYEVTFMIQTIVDHDGIETNNTFHWGCIVPEQNDRAQYRSVKDQAARQVAPMLRSLADKIEADLPKFDDQSA